MENYRFTKGISKGRPKGNERSLKENLKEPKGNERIERRFEPVTPLRPHCRPAPRLAAALCDIIEPYIRSMTNSFLVRNVVHLYIILHTLGLFSYLCCVSGYALRVSTALGQASEALNRCKLQASS